MQAPHFWWRREQSWLAKLLAPLGALVGGALAIGFALYQFWGDWVSLGIIAAVFALGQFVEGNILTPRLVGKSVGLHPVWLMFALLAFGYLFGFAGILLAVPLAAREASAEAACCISLSSGR